MIQTGPKVFHRTKIPKNLLQNSIFQISAIESAVFQFLKSYPPFISAIFSTVFKKKNGHCGGKAAFIQHKVKAQWADFASLAGLMSADVGSKSYDIL